VIITVTPNPAVDRTYEVGTLQLGEVQRAAAVYQDAGGKGVNIARALHLYGVDTVAVFPAGGASGAELVTMLRHLGVSVVSIPVANETRSNITIADDGGNTTKLNAPGSALSPEAADTLIEAVVEQIRMAKQRGTKAAGSEAPVQPIVVGAGSLPDGTDPAFYARLAQAAIAEGALIAIDTAGEPLSRAVTSGGLAVVKPNLAELTELAHRPLTTVGEVVATSRGIIGQGNEGIIGQGNEQVLVTLGAAGAILVTADTWWWAGGQPLTARSTVGAGDLTLAGYLAAAQAGADLPTALQIAVAWGRAAVLEPGTRIPAPTAIKVDQVQVVAEPDPGTVLDDSRA